MNNQSKNQWAKQLSLMLTITWLMMLPSCSGAQSSKIENMNSTDNRYQTATIGGGCFWCIEAIYLDIRGVVSATSGFSGGKIKNPTYREVISGLTSHAEVVQIVFDPEVITYRDILTIFFHVHDPTTLNRQGADVGTQYRSVIFYHDETQKAIAEEVMNEIGLSGLWSNTLVTELSPLTAFYRAEDYHQNYFANNPNAPYCVYVVSPKLEKFRKNFDQFLK